MNILHVPSQENVAQRNTKVQGKTHLWQHCQGWEKGIAKDWKGTVVVAF